MERRGPLGRMSSCNKDLDVTKHEVNTSPRQAWRVNAPLCAPPRKLSIRGDVRP
jgi:hypothetical protein